MFVILKTGYFQLWVLYINESRISTTVIYIGIIGELNISKHKGVKNIFPIIDLSKGFKGTVGNQTFSSCTGRRGRSMKYDYTVDGTSFV